MDYFSSDDAIGTQPGESVAYPVEKWLSQAVCAQEWRAAHGRRVAG